MDIFSVFDTANKIYCKLQQDDPGVDVSLPIFANGIQNEDAMNIVITPSSPGLKDKGVVTSDSSPYQEFGRLPQEIQCDKNSAVAMVKGFISSLGKLNLSLYKEFAGALAVFFDKINIDGIIKGFANLTSSSENFQVKVKMTAPARIEVYSVEGNCNFIYKFADQKGILSGFSAPDSIKDVAAKAFSIPMTELVIKDALVSERYTGIVLGERVIYLNEDFNSIYQQTADEILDKVVQKLIQTDTLDTLQDVILDENTGGLLLCFDPILDLDEISKVIEAIKLAYPQVRLVSSPEGGNSPYWCVEVAKIPDSELEINGPLKRGGFIGKPSEDTVSQIANEIDINQAVNAVAKG